MTALTISELDPAAATRDSRVADVLSTGETAECECPDFCERDHANE